MCVNKQTPKLTSQLSVFFVKVKRCFLVSMPLRKLKNAAMLKNHTKIFVILQAQYSKNDSIYLCISPSPTQDVDKEMHRTEIKSHL